MKKTGTIVFSALIVVLITSGIIYYLKKDKSANSVDNNIKSEIQIETQKNSSNVENAEQTSNIEIGKTEKRNFIIDNVYHSASQGDIHFASYYPKDYDKNKEYAIYFALPGWEGLYFQGVGANMNEPYPYEAQKYNKDMIIISPQLNDWSEKSANDTIALVEYFLSNYNIDKNKVYISGASGGGETLSIILGKKPELFTSALFISSQWDGNLDVLANSKTPLYMVIGENDSYYGSTKAKNAYNNLQQIYKKQGLTDEEINNILVLDVKKHEYFTSQGIKDEHAGLGLFAYDSNVMNWIFSKTK